MVKRGCTGEVERPPHHGGVGGRLPQRKVIAASLADEEVEVWR